MQKVRFFANEPRIVDIEVESPILGTEDLIKHIEQQYPDLVDIEIDETEIVDE